MKRRTILMGAKRGPWVPIQEDGAQLVVAGLVGAEVTIEHRDTLGALTSRTLPNGTHPVPDRGWLRALCEAACPTLVCQLEH